MIAPPSHENVSDPELSASLERAIAAHHAGRLAEAEADYHRVLAIDAAHFDARHMLAIIHAQRREFEEAERLIQSALMLAPDHAEAHFNRGNIQRELGQFEEALASYERTLALAPDHVGAHSNRGLALYELGRFGEALASYDRALALRPDDAAIHTNRGNALFKLGRLQEALSCHDRSISLKPDYADAHSNRGTTLLELDQQDAALASYARAVELKSDAAEPHFHRGIALARLKRWEQAVASYDRAILLKPDHFDAYANRGQALLQQGRADAALADFARMIALKPDSAQAHHNVGIALFVRDQLDDALASFERAIARNPEFAAAHHNAGLLLLLNGDFARGWDEFEWRWTNTDLAPTRRSFPQPLWLGDEDVAGKTVLLHGEQGFGDAIQFCRYVPMVAKRGAKVVLEVSPALTDLMRSIAGSPEIVGFGAPLPDFQLHCPLLSLPLAFKTRVDTIPAGVPYLSPPRSSVEKWKSRIPPATVPRIGVVWAGNPKHGNDSNRSVGLRAMLPLLSQSGARFFSLQKELREGDREILRGHPDIVHLGDELETFTDTAAIVSLLDLVISIDTSIVHLAGALAKPVWILLPYTPDWRWQLDRADSPWYPTARLFRRSRRADWSEVIAQIAREISRHF
jgi:tetratricopeptide (TPR) repeat protein